jgi:fatty acid desaturase
LQKQSLDREEKSGERVIDIDSDSETPFTINEETWSFFESFDSFDEFNIRKEKEKNVKNPTITKSLKTVNYFSVQFYVLLLLKIILFSISMIIIILVFFFIFLFIFHTFKIIKEVCLYLFNFSF